MTRAAFVLLLLPGALAAQGRDPLDSVNRFVEHEIQRQRIPGLSVAILRGDRVLLARGYGFANLELRVPASDSTVYQSGSVGKQFTAAAIVMLAEQGRLRLDDSITKWLPEGKRVWDGITVRHLLTHTSGIAEYTDSTFDYRRDYTEDDLVRFAASRPLDFRPGDRWSYSNTGYLLLGVVIHKVTERFYGDVLHDLIFTPVGMRRTRIISEADLVPDRAAGYHLVHGEVKNQEWVSPSLNTTADGALYFTVDDLANWAVALNHQRIPSPAGLAAAWTPVRLNDGGTYPYGFGWRITEQRGHRRIGHGGAWQGFRTAIFRYPEFDLTVIALANLAEAEPEAIASGIAGILEPALVPPHLLAAPFSGMSPPQPIPELLRNLAAGRDSAVMTVGLARFVSPELRKSYGELLSPARSWQSLGCDRVADRGIARLGSSVDRICYARGLAAGSGTVVSVFYAPDGRVAALEDYEF